jgi:hypothetical protein
MRSVIPFETERAAASIDETLDEHDWLIDNGLPDGPSEPLSDAEGVERSNHVRATKAAIRTHWLSLIEDVAPYSVLSAQEAALRSQQYAEEQLAEHPGEGSQAVLQKQHSATAVQKEAFLAEEESLLHQGDGNSSRPGFDAALGLDISHLAAREAGEILKHVADTDKELAIITFQYPIFDRQTQTFGTVHYEPDMHHTTVRLKNEQSEKLKVATQRLVEGVVIGKPDVRRSARILNAARKAGRAITRLWFRSGHRYRRLIVFGRIRVLEPGSSNEAFSGTVVAERSLDSVIRERRGDLTIAGVFLFLGLTVSILSSPWIWDFDLRLHNGTWSDGWLAWVAGNLSRIGSAFFVGAFLPVIQIWLYWRSVRRKPSVEWHIDVAEP